MSVLCREFELRLDTLVNKKYDRLITETAIGGTSLISKQNIEHEIRELAENAIKRMFGGNNEKESKSVMTEKLRILTIQEKEEDKVQIEFKMRTKFKVEVQADYHQSGRISKVRLPFTTSQWTDVLNAQGMYLPSCCGDISYIRDVLTNSLRNDKYIDVGDLSVIAMYLTQHEGGGCCSDDTNDPIAIIVELDKKLKPYYRSDKIGSSNVNNPKDALQQLSQLASEFTMNDFLGATSQEAQDVKKTNHLASLARIIPAVKTVYEKIKELDTGPINGWAVMRGSEIITQRDGRHGIYLSEDLAKSVCEAVIKDAKLFVDKDTKPEDINFNVRSVKISIENGIEFC